MKRFRSLHLAALALLVSLGRIHAQDGFCMVNGTTTGGAGGTTFTVTNSTDFITHATASGPRIIQVEGPISIGQVNPTSNKSFIGLGTNATLLGLLHISGVSNIIVQNLRFTNPGNDGISIRDPNTHHVWVDHVTFYDCGDGSCDISQGADYVTVSWCKFLYPTQVEHKFTMIADGTVSGQGRITLHHNWWGTGSGSRMPASSYGRIHLYNNYFNCTNNSYCSNARTDTQFLVENSYYAGVRDPLYKESTGLIQASNNIFVGTSGKVPDAGTDSVFTPPYAYALDPAANVPAIVRAGAGAAGPDTVIIPPKIWNGGGANNNWNTVNNWGLNIGAPKAYDTLLFNGNTRLNNTNNFSSGTGFTSLLFSNTAGAFVLSGNRVSLLRGITNDSAAVQTLNFPLDLSAGIDHFGNARTFVVSDLAGSLVLNGNITGASNSFFSSYVLTKTGAGEVILNGINSFRASLALNGGKVAFQTLDTSAPGSLGVGTTITINGGGLRWLPGNTADISARTVTINAGGATLDVAANTVTFADRIGNNGTGSLTKLGAGQLTFNATNNYRGNTVIVEGTLALGPTGALTNSPQIILSNNAVLDVSGRTDATLTLVNRQTLTGNGSVLGSAIAASGSTVTPGHSIGALFVTNALTFQSGSTNLMQLDKAASTNDIIEGMQSVNYGGRLVVTNLGGALAPGDTFKLFSAENYSGSFDSFSLPALTGNLYWTNRLALDGTLAVVAPINPTPTNITILSTFTNSLVLSWPEDHIGWILETNAVAVTQTNAWHVYPDSHLTNQVIVPVDPAATNVYYRLVLPE